MSFNNFGVQKLIRNDAPLATYIHCSGHCLNLVISDCCRIPAVRNMLDKLKNCCKFFLHSPKRNILLEKVLAENEAELYSTLRKVDNAAASIELALQAMTQAEESLRKSMHSD